MKSWPEWRRCRGDDPRKHRRARPDRGRRIEIAFRITNEKFTHHRLLQEAVLELSAMAILYGSDIGDKVSEGVVLSPGAGGGPGN